MSRLRTFFAATVITAISVSPLLASWDDGVAAYRAGRYQEAAEAFRTFVSRSPDQPAGHYMLGMSLFQQKRYADALKTLRKAQELGPDDARNALAVAQAQLKLEQGNAALETLASLSEVPANLSKNHHQLLAHAAELSGRSHASAAKRQIEQALAADPGSKALWVALAGVTGRAGQPGKKFAALAKAFELDQNDAELGRKALHVAMSSAQSEGIDQASRAEWYLKAAEVGQPLATRFPTPENLRRVGEAEMAAHRYESAIERFERLLAAGDDDARLRYYLGSSYQALKQNEKALSHLQGALDNSPDAELVAKIHSARGWTYRNQEKFDLAAAAFREAGDRQRADEMAGYAKNRQEWAQAKADCLVKRTQIEKMRQDSEDLEGTSEWQELNRELDAVLAACQPYFEDKT